MPRRPLEPESGESIHMTAGYPQPSDQRKRARRIAPPQAYRYPTRSFWGSNRRRRRRPLPDGPFSRNSTVKQTFNPSRLKRARTHGFRARSATRNGRKVLQARRAKGRARLAT